MGSDKLSTAATDGSLFVSDIDSATCAFCPYGSKLVVGDRIKIYDEKTVFSRKTRERDVQVTAVKLFRATARQITLDLQMISDEEAQKIAYDNDLTVEILLNHRAGNSHFDPNRPPMVVYFTPND